MTAKTETGLLPDNSLPLVWRPSAPVGWRTRQCIRIDVLTHRNFPLSLAVASLLGLLAVVPFAIATLLLAEIDGRLAFIPVVAGGPVLGGLVIRINEQLSHRLTGRAASPAEFAALQDHSPARECVFVQAAAADWRTMRPRVLVIIAIMLRWQDEAAAKVREAMPIASVEALGHATSF